MRVSIVQRPPKWTNGEDKWGLTLGDALSAFSASTSAYLHLSNECLIHLCLLPLPPLTSARASHPMSVTRVPDSLLPLSVFLCSLCLWYALLCSLDWCLVICCSFCFCSILTLDVLILLIYLRFLQDIITLNTNYLFCINTNYFFVVCLCVRPAANSTNNTLDDLKPVAGLPKSPHDWCARLGSIGHESWLVAN